MSEHPWDFDPIVAHLLRSSNVLGHHLVVEELKPTPKQYALGPGDSAIVASTESEIDEDFTIVTILDPEEHKEQYPEYETQLMNSFVLCAWQSHFHPEIETGWFARMKLIKISGEQYEELAKQVESSDYADGPPNWVHELYSEFMSELASASPGKVPTTVSCGICNSSNVELHASYMTRLAARIGVFEKEGDTYYAPLNRPTTNEVVTAHLHCNECEAEAELSEDEMARIKMPSHH